MVNRGIPVNWKNRLAPKAPIKQPGKHQVVFLAVRPAARGTCLRQ